MQSPQCSAATHPLPLQTSILGPLTDACALCGHYQNRLSFSGVPVFKTLQKSFPWTEWVRWRAASSEDRLLMPGQGQKVSGLMLANLQLSLIELISGVMGWGQSPSSFHWQHNRLMKLLRSELQAWWEVSEHWSPVRQGSNIKLRWRCQVCAARADKCPEVNKYLLPGIQSVGLHSDAAHASRSDSEQSRHSVDEKKNFIANDVVTG